MSKMIEMVDAAMTEMANITPPLRRSECERLIRAALATTRPETPPDGWNLVPTAVTKEMREAFGNQLDGACGSYFDWNRGGDEAYASLLAAAPEVQASRIVANAKLLTALQFYADKQLYEDFATDECRAAFDRNIGSTLGNDAGQRARDAISTCEDDDHTLRSSVPERWKSCTSGVGAVQSYIAELETEASQVHEEIARWYAKEGWLLDEGDVPAAIRALAERKL